MKAGYSFSGWINQLLIKKKSPLPPLPDVEQVNCHQPNQGILLEQKSSIWDVIRKSMFYKQETFAD